MRIAVVGAGIAGLSAAWDLSATPGVEVSVFDPGPPGGKLRTTLFAGRPVDEGPDAFLCRTPEATDLCAELGVDDLIAPAAGRTLLWVRGRLRPLPEGLMLGVPARVGPLLRSRLLTPAGLARAGMDLVLPRRNYGEDVSAGELIAGRFGREVATRLVEPLLGGIHAAPLDQLSAAVVAPQVLAAARSSRSLLLGLRAQVPPPNGGPRSPIFLTPASGLASLVERLTARLESRGVTFRSQSVGPVTARPGGVTLTPAGGAPEDFDAAVLAVPAPAAAGMLGEDAPAGLAGIEFTSVAVLTVAVAADRWSPPAGFNGFLVPTGEGRLITAGSFFTNKWPGSPDRTARSPDGRPVHVLRISAGRHGDDRVDRKGDAELTDALLGELAQAVGSHIETAEARLTRWPASFPLYRVGHAPAVDRMEAELAARSRRVALAGSSYRGAGIPACIRSGRAAAQAVLAGVAA